LDLIKRNRGEFITTNFLQNLAIQRMGANPPAMAYRGCCYQGF